MFLNRLQGRSRAYGQSQLRASRLDTPGDRLLKGGRYDAPLLTLSRLPVIVGCCIRGRGKEKHLMVPIGVHAPMPKEDDPLRSAQQGDSMRHHEGGPECAQFFERRLDQRLRLRFDRRGRLV